MAIWDRFWDRFTAVIVPWDHWAIGPLGTGLTLRGWGIETPRRLADFKYVEYHRPDRRVTSQGAGCKNQEFKFIEPNWDSIRAYNLLMIYRYKIYIYMICLCHGRRGYLQVKQLQLISMMRI